MTNINFPEWDPEYEVIDPTELGWVELRPHVWRKPNGEEHTFPENGQDVIVRLRLPSDPKRQH
jgi:hypothetical protein